MALSAEDIKLIEDIKEDWTNLFFSCPKINKPQARKTIEWLYTKANLKKPEIIFATGPTNAQAKLNRKTYCDFSGYVNAWDFSWLGYNEFYEKKGIINDKDFSEYKELFKNSGIFLTIQQKNKCVICPFPKFIRTNDRGFFHSYEGPSMQWTDGTKLYYINDVLFEEKLYKKLTSGKMKFEDILKIKNIDQRTQAFYFGDKLKFFAYTEAQTLDTMKKTLPNKKEITYHLMFLDQDDNDIFENDVCLLYYECPSTGREYISGVPNTMQTVAESMSWKFGITQKQWKDMVPLLDES